MILTDILLITALAVFVIVWWVRKTPARRIVLIASAALAIVIGAAGYFNDRWQDAGGAFIGVVFLLGLGGVVLKNRITKTDRTGGVPWFSGIFIAIGLIATIALIREFPINPLPKPTGQYAVGVRTFEIDDASRPGVFAAKPNEPRRLLVRVWSALAGVAVQSVPEPGSVSLLFVAGGLFNSHRAEAATKAAVQKMDTITVTATRIAPAVKMETMVVTAPRSTSQA